MAGWLWNDYKDKVQPRQRPDAAQSTVKERLFNDDGSIVFNDDARELLFSEQKLLETYLRSWLVRRPVQTVALYAGGTVQFDVFKLNAEQKIPQVAHPLEQLLASPNPFCGGGQLIMQTIAYRFLSQKGAFWLISRDSDGVPRRIWQLPPHRVEVIPGKSGEEFIRGYKYRPDDRITQIYTPHDVIYFQSFNPVDPYSGSSEVAALAYVLETQWLREQREYHSQRGGHAAQAVYTSDAPPPSGEAGELFKHYLTKRHTGMQGVNEPLILWYGLKRDQGFSPTEMLHTEQVGLARLLANNAMGLSSAIGTENANRATIDGALKEIVDVTLYPLCTLIAEQITVACRYGALDYYSDVIVEVRDFREKNTALLIQKATLLKDGIVNADGGRDPVITRDEFRAMFGLPEWHEDDAALSALQRQLAQIGKEVQSLKDADPFWRGKL